MSARQRGDLAGKAVERRPRPPDIDPRRANGRTGGCFRPTGEGRGLWCRVAGSLSSKPLTVSRLDPRKGNETRRPKTRFGNLLVSALRLARDDSAAALSTTSSRFVVSRETVGNCVKKGSSCRLAVKTPVSRSSTRVRRHTTLIRQPDTPDAYKHFQVLSPRLSILLRSLPARVTAESPSARTSQKALQRSGF